MCKTQHLSTATVPINQLCYVTPKPGFKVTPIFDIFTMKDELGFGSNADGVIYRDLSHDGISNDL